MSDKKPPASFLKSLSDSILLSSRIPYTDISQITANDEWHLDESETRKFTVHDQSFAGQSSLVRVGGSLLVFTCLLIIVCTHWLVNERIGYTKVYSDAIVAEFDGWGTSLAWWAEFIGSIDQEKQKDFIARVFHPSREDSLQFNIIRFNMGGAQPILPNGTTPGVDFAPFKGIPSMQLSNQTYDWEADKFQLAVVQEILLLNNDTIIVEAFSNSPPYWMTKSQNSMGNYDGSDNLDQSNYTLFANYIASVVDHAINVWNIPITYVEPFNEPDFGWRVRPQNQEGSHWDHSSMKKFVPLLLDALEAKNLHEKVNLTISDSFSIKEALHSLDTFDDVVHKANVHGYGNDVTFQIPAINDFVQRVRRRNNIQKVWMSESGGYGLGDQGVVGFAFDIIKHLNLLEAEAWIYWQVLDQTPSWALILISDRYPWWLSQYNYYPHNTINFYTMQQFSNHIKQGYSILKTSQSNYKDDCSPICVLAASSKIDGNINKVIIVLVNNTPRSYNHDIDISDLMMFNNQTKIECYRTAEWNGDYHTKVDHAATLRSRKSIKVILFGLSVTTIEVS